MKPTLSLPLAALLLLAVDARPQQPPAPAAAESSKPAATDPEAWFTALLRKASLSGRWAPLRDGALGEERGGDTYQIQGVTKTDGDRWVVHAKLKYRQQEFVLPIPVRIQFVGDTAIMIVDGLTIPEGGTYSARLIFHSQTYSGSWTGGRGGGMLYGVITNQKE